MLKPIHYVPCSPALRACRRLQERFVGWLCDEATTVGDTTRENLEPPCMPTRVEADWLWAFLARVQSKKPLIERARAIADMSPIEKRNLLNWVQIVSGIAAQFTPYLITGLKPNKIGLSDAVPGKSCCWLS